MKTLFKTLTIIILIMGVNFSAESRNTVGGGITNPGPVGGLYQHIGYYLEEYTYLDGADNEVTAYRVRSVIRYTYFSCMEVLLERANLQGNSLIQNCNI